MVRVTNLLANVIHRRCVTVVLHIASCFCFYALSVAFGIYAFVGSLGNMYLFHLGNAITIMYMINTTSLLQRCMYPIVSFAAYVMVRRYTQSYDFMVVVGTFNFVEQCTGSYMMRYLLSREQRQSADSLRFIAVVVGVTLVISTLFSVPGSLAVSTMAEKGWKPTFLTWFFSHVSGNYIGLYALHVLRNATLPTPKFIGDFIVSCFATAMVHCFKDYEIFEVSALITSFAVIAFVAVRNEQDKTVITELALLLIIFVCVINGRGPYVAIFTLCRYDRMQLIMSLYTLVIFSSVTSALLSVVMKQRRNALERVMTLKNDLLFISSQVSHDVRAPLMHVMDVCRIMRFNSNAVTNEDLEDAQTSCDAITDIMDSWLCALRSSGDDSKSLLQKSVESCDMRVFFAKVLSYGRRACRGSFHNDLHLEMVNTDHIPPRLKIDRRLLYQVIINLVSNAIKYTAQGTVFVEASYDTDTLIVRVIDTGCGIPEEYLPVIFDKFVRVKVPGSTDDVVHQNHGVGLAIVKTLLNAMAGRVDVQSVVGSGSTFTVTVPAEIDDSEVEEVSSASKQSIALEDIHVCIAEDDRVCQKLFNRMLSACASVDIVGHGDHVVNQLMSSEYNVLCLDGSLPGLQGHEIMDRLLVLRQTEEKIRKLGVVDISGGAVCQEYVLEHVVPCPKPFTADLLIAAVLEAACMHKRKLSEV